MTPALRTARLLLRPLGPADAPALHEIASIREVVRQLGSWPWPPDPTFTLSRSRPYEGEGDVWGMILVDRLIGTTAVTKGDLGYMMHPDCAGAGLMTEACTAALDHHFAARPDTPVTACIWADNAASGRVLEKLGFVRTHETVSLSKARQVETPSIHFRLDPSDWSART